uniref:Uncharacterized protein n=1 Tax=Noctiluca scintillans TaxID=2966 RepID=A0A7S0ZPR1_NOCSC|mmetsp:Transcript_13825/g.37851  ORF Transcript_13825/g.37851 Transcript_13825/m.37851 type:complete len:183 (+) Transcript_13825:60-608(+)
MELCDDISPLPPSHFVYSQGLPMWWSPLVHPDTPGVLGVAMMVICIPLICVTITDIGMFILFFFARDEFTILQFVQAVLENMYLIMFSFLLIIANVGGTEICARLQGLLFTHFRFLAHYTGRAFMCFHISCRAVSCSSENLFFWVYMMFSCMLSLLGVAMLVKRTLAPPLQCVGQGGVTDST